MSELLTTKRMSIVPTMCCTLKCKLCSNHMPEFKKPGSATYEEIIRDIDAVFALFDRIEWLQFVGGEIFLNPHMAEVFRYCTKYRDRFSKLIVETNATLPLREAEIEALALYGENADVMISDYGELSKNRDNNVAALEKAGVPYRLKKYYGEDQHFGGWIDNTGLRDYGEPQELVEQLASGCAQVRLENMHLYRGKLHRCSNSLFMMELGVVDPNPRDYLDLYDETLTREEKRAVVRDFYTKARKSCRYCTWKSGDSAERHSAAEQMKERTHNGV
ncbi:MAG: radical SAM protein [Oscillospiraceae bacterium]|nr:radical SAM protein [Oscillospiraceae bacterium]